MEGAVLIIRILKNRSLRSRQKDGSRRPPFSISLFGKRKSVKKIYTKNTIMEVENRVMEVQNDQLFIVKEEEETENVISVTTL